ncbi:MAG: L,D-transpeptidase family protein [Clostridiaceae bacterium]|nr:L,D-transpeptidase family protein [Clostridiaceae bacterium]
MKNTVQRWKQIFFTAVLLMAAAGVLPAQAKAEATVAVTTDRSTGSCSYTVTGIDASTGDILVTVTRKSDSVVVLEQKTALTETDVTNGSYTGSFSMTDFSSYEYGEYQVTIKAGDVQIGSGSCDFTIHQSNISLTVEGDASSAKRVVKLTSSEESGGVLVPGSGNKVSVQVWKNGKAESSAKTLGSSRTIAGSSISWSVNITKAGSGYGDWNAKVVLSNTNSTDTVTLVSAAYTVDQTKTGFAAKKTSALEKKAAFGITLKGLKNPYGVKKVTYQIYNSKGKKVYSKKAKKKSSGNQYYAEVKMKELSYKLDTYTVRAVVTDSNGNTRTLDSSCTAAQTAVEGKWKITKKQDATCAAKLTGAYLPGNIKKVQFVVYRQTDGSKTKKKLAVYSAKASSNGKSYSARISHSVTGSYAVYAYGYTRWGKKVLLNEKSYSMKKKDMGKNGWYYEKYQGTKYKFYYINNVKQTDLTDILNIKKGGSGSQFLIEINRAACVVTIYMYDSDTGKYDIPVKTCTVSVGRDVSTVAGTSGLNTNSSYTPLGTYSICTNGEAVRYSLKTMHEPDGSIVYARWCSHIVGNVYFHAVAVSSQSHYALSSYSYNRLGSPASAGCVRMTVADAKWIYDYASTGTKVKILQGNSSKPGPLGKNATITIQGVSYDPTDPAVPDSTKKKDYKAGKISGYMTKSGKKVGY